MNAHDWVLIAQTIVLAIVIYKLTRIQQAIEPASKLASSGLSLVDEVKGLFHL